MNGRAPLNEPKFTYVLTLYQFNRTNKSMKVRTRKKTSWGTNIYFSSFRIKYLEDESKTLKDCLVWGISGGNEGGGGSGGGTKSVVIVW